MDIKNGHNYLFLGDFLMCFLTEKSQFSDFFLNVTFRNQSSSFGDEGGTLMRF